MMKTMVSLGFFALMATGLSAAQNEGSFDKSVSVSGRVELDATTDSGSITVRTGSPGIVKVHGILKADHGWFSSGDVQARIQELERHPPVEQNGNRVRAGYVLGRDALKNISMELEIEVPPDTGVRARADSGGIQVEGVHGPVDCKTDSGGLRISDVSSDVRAVADSGGIQIEHVTGSLMAHGDSGSIKAIGIAGSIDAQTDSGSITLEQTAAATVNAKVESGSVRVKLAPGAGYDIRADTDSGGIHVPSMTAQGVLSSQHVEGKIGNGGPLVRVHADSGSVTINN